METWSEAKFKQDYALHLQHLKLKGLQPKTIEAYSRAMRRIGARFDHQIDSLSEQQLVDFFTELLASHSWSAVKLDLYGLKFYYAHVLRKPWVAPGLIKPPKTQRLPDLVTVEEVKRIFAATRVLSDRVFFFTLYSLGLRLGEGLRLQVGDIDAARGRAHIRDAKGNRDLPSVETVHDSARAGTMLVVPRSNSTSRLNVGTDAASKVVPVVKNCGWNPSGLPSEQYTRLPFAAAPRGSSKANAKASAVPATREYAVDDNWSMRGLGGNVVYRAAP